MKTIIHLKIRPLSAGYCFSTTKAFHFTKLSEEQSGPNTLISATGMEGVSKIHTRKVREGKTPVQMELFLILYPELTNFGRFQHVWFACSCITI